MQFNGKFSFDFNNYLLLFINKPIQYLFNDNQIFFNSKDITVILEYEYNLQTIKKYVHADDIINDNYQNIYINESGFYSIMLSSKNDEIIEFKKWVSNFVLPLISRNGNIDISDNYFMNEDLDKYENKDCVYIINIKNNIYKYGYSSHIFRRLKDHKSNLKYTKIIKIYSLNNINDAIKLEMKIKKLVYLLNINITYNNHIEIFEIDDSNLKSIIDKINKFHIKLNAYSKLSDINLELINKNLMLENENLKLKLLIKN